MEIRLRNMTSVYLTRGEQLLMLHRMGSRVANGKFIGSAGGHFEAGELNDPLTCILREIGEELGLEPSDIEDLRLRYITHRLKNGEIRQNYYYFGELRGQYDLASTEGQLHWVDFRDIPAMDMPVSAKHMILHYLQEGRFDSQLRAGITEETGTAFHLLREFGD